MHETVYQGPPKVVVAITSMRSLLADDRSRREVRIPRRDELPANVAWLKSRDEVEYPAVIGLTGRVTDVKDIGDQRVAQWNVSCFPYTTVVRDRLSRDDLQDLVTDLHRELTRVGVMRGAWYTAYFSVPMYAGTNFFESAFECAGLARREEERRVRKSWNPFVVLRHALGLGRSLSDPWLEDKATNAVVARTIKEQGAKILGKIWDKWSQSPDVAPTLKMLRVPIDDPKQTVYRHGDAHQRIFENLTPISRKTMFLGDIPDDFEEEIERKLANQT